MWEKLNSKNLHLLIPDVTIVRYLSYDGIYVKGVFKRFNDRGVTNSVWANWSKKDGHVSYGHMPFESISFFFNVVVDLDQDDDECI